MKFRSSLIAMAISPAVLPAITVAETTIGGYGELHYNNWEQTATSGLKTDKAEVDFHRFVLEFGHDFNDHIRFFSELELEHALVEDSADGSGPGEIELEQAYIEIDMDNTSVVRSGVFLLPIGIINETHEPTAFYGVERNPVEKDIIPATWWEAGVMYSAHMAIGLSYDLAIHTGLSAADGNIRNGRQKAAKANGDSLAYTARIKYTGMPGLEIAGTAQVQTDLAQGDITAGNAEGATLMEAHAIYTIGPFKASALYAKWDIDFDISNSKEEQDGMMLEASYKVNEKLGIFVRQNDWSTTVNEDKSQTVAGFNYWPHEDVVFKFDYQTEDHDNATESDGFNLGLGYQF